MYTSGSSCLGGAGVLTPPNLTVFKFIIVLLI